MQIQRIIIRNILGLQHLEILPGKLTIVEGQNGAGKTSVLEAIKAALSGGNDATLLRQGSESGEVVLLLDDETEIRRRITAEGSSLTVKNEAGRVKAPQTYLDKLIDRLSLNPVSFLLAPPNKRAEWLLEMLPLELEPEALVIALGEPVIPARVERAKKMLAKTPVLDLLTQLRTDVYDQRTGSNRLVKEKRLAATEMERSLPPIQEGTDWAEEARALEVESGSVRTDRQVEIDKAREHAHRNELGLQQLHSQQLADLLKEQTRKIEEIKAEYANYIAVVDEATSRQKQSIASALEQTLARIEETTAPSLERLAADLSRARTMAEAEVRAQSARELLDRMRVEATSAEEESEHYSSVIRDLDLLRASLLESLPIPGLEIKDGEVYLDNISFDRLNKAKQVQLALRIAKLRAKDFPLVVVDGLEMLDAETFDAFVRAVPSSGLQVVGTRVTSDELHVTTAA